MPLTNQDLQTYAARRLAAMRKRGARHLAQAQANRGDAHNLTLASLLDDLCVEAAEVARVTSDLCGMASDFEAARVINADLYGTCEALRRNAIDCRMAALGSWPPAVLAANQQALQ